MEGIPKHTSLPSEMTSTHSVAAAQADVFQKNSNNKLNKIDTNMKIKR